MLARPDSPMVLLLPNRLTHADAMAGFDAMALQVAQLPPGSPVVLSGRALQVFDSSALGVLLALRRLADKAGRAFEFREVPPRLVGLANLYGAGAWLAS